MKFNSLLKLIKGLDRFAFHISLTNKGKEEYKSALGGLFSLIAYGVILINAWILGMDIYKKENPIVISSEENNSPMNISLVPDDFFLAFYFSDLNNNLFEDDTIVSLKAFFYSNFIYENGSQSFNENEVELVSCNKTYIKNNSLIEYSFLSKLKCIKNTNILLGGSWSESYIYGLNFHVSYCKNDSLKSDCKSSEQIEEVIRFLYINIYHQSLQVNAKNYNNPIKKFRALSFFRLETTLYKEIEFYLQKHNILTDSGIIFPDFIQTHSEIGILNVNVDVSLNKDNLIALLNLYLTSDIKIYNRSYIKVQTIFANLGGIINILFLVGKIIITSIMTKNFKLKLINTFFATKNLKLEKVNKFVTPMSKEKDLHSSIRPNSINVLCLRDNAKIDVDNYIKSIQMQKLKFSKIEMLQNLFDFKKCKKKDKFVIFEQGMKYLNNFTDLISLVKHMEDLLKMKYLLLNENQLIALDFFSKMSYNNEQIYHKIESFNQIFSHKGEIKERLYKTIKYFHTNNLMKSDLDKKIFNNLEVEIQNFIVNSSTLLK
jgi:hypothetical protein